MPGGSLSVYIVPQVEFDSAYYEEEQRMEASAASKERRLKEMVRRVIQNKPKHGEGYTR
jgi:hypothetical protein